MRDSRLPSDNSPSAAGQDAGDTAPASRELLEKILEQTNAAQLSLGGEQEDPAPFREVAERYRGRPLELDPIGIELVQAALVEYFRSADVSARDWRTVAGWVAGVLFDDPGSRQRLAVLWSRLQEPAP